VAAEGLRSQGKHTPFAGWPLRGRVRCTIAAGQLAYESAAAA
jgi:dihydroorotase